MSDEEKEEYKRKSKKRLYLQVLVFSMISLTASIIFQVIYPITIKYFYHLDTYSIFMLVLRLIILFFPVYVYYTFNKARKRTIEEKAPIRAVPPNSFNEPEEARNRISQHLKPNEQLLFTFKLKSHIIKNVLISIIGIVIFGVGIPVLMLAFDNENVYFEFVLLSIFLIGLGLLTVFLEFFTCLSEVSVKNYEYFFTSEKIVMLSRNLPCLIYYDNIMAIDKGKAGLRNYQIIVKLKEPVPNNPFFVQKYRGMEVNLNLDVMYIYKIPKNNDLINKLAYLLEGIK